MSVEWPGLSLDIFGHQLLVRAYIIAKVPPEGQFPFHYGDHTRAIATRPAGRGTRL